MTLTVDQLISTLRLEASITNSQAGLTDTGLLDMTDDNLVTILTLGATRLNTDADTLEELLEDTEDAYPIMLVAKIELFTMLATLKADLVDMNADNNNRLSLGQRFEHYMKLANAAEDLFNDWNADNDASTGGTGGVVTTYDVIHTKHFMSVRNYQLQAAPKVKLKIRNITETSADLSWTITGIDHFGLCKLYIGTSPVFDVYLDGGKATDKVTSNAKLLKSSANIRDNTSRVSGLVAGTTYYVAVVAIERNLVYGYTQKAFTTIEVEEEDETE